MSELLPCPFCGAKANAFQFGTDDAYVICSQCNGKNYVSYPSKEAAIKAWNTRISEPLTPEERSKLVEDVAKAIYYTSADEEPIPYCDLTHDEKQLHHLMAKAALSTIEQRYVTVPKVRG